MSGSGDSSGVHADPVHLLVVLLGFNAANGQAKVTFKVVALQKLLVRATFHLWLSCAE